jgi:DNA-directed RNA polymerase subunit RPC12/RpoP
MYVVITCYKCGQLLLAKTDQRTRQCPYCEARLILDKTKKVASAKTAQEASVLIRALKRKKNVKTLELDSTG